MNDLQPERNIQLYVQTQSIGIRQIRESEKEPDYTAAAGKATLSPRNLNNSRPKIWNAMELCGNAEKHQSGRNHFQTPRSFLISRLQNFGDRSG